MFTNTQLHITEENVDDPIFSEGLLSDLNNDDRDDTLYFATDRFLLNQNESRNLELPNFSQNEWIYIILKVDGEVRINIVGQDYGSSVPIQSSTRAFGNSRWQGILLMTTINVLSIQVIGVSEFSRVESYASVIVEEDDARLLTN
jgi:hypothetical protein